MAAARPCWSSRGSNWSRAPHTMRADAVIVAVSVGGRAVTSPASVSRHTYAGMRTRPSMYHRGTGWKRGNQARNLLTQAASTGSVK